MIVQSHPIVCSCIAGDYTIVNAHVYKSDAHDYECSFVKCLPQ